MKLGEKLRYLREVEGSMRGLDRAMTQQELVRAISALPAEFGVGILLVEENAEVAATLCRQVVVLQLGQVAYSGGAQELFGDAQLRDSLLALPAHGAMSGRPL